MSGTHTDVDELHALLEPAASTMLRLDAQGRVTWMNGRARAWLLPPGAALPLSVAELAGLEASTFATTGMQDVVVAPAGLAPTVCRIASSPWPGGGRLVVLTPVQDLRAQAHQEMQARQDLLRRFHIVTSAAGVGYWTLEHGAERARWSDELRSMHGLQPDDAPPTFEQWIGEFIHPDDRASVRQSFAAWSREGYPPHQAHMRALRRDGRVIDLITHSRAEGDPASPLLFGMVLDVTERRAAEAAQRELRAKSRFLSRMSHELRTPLNAVLGFTELMLAPAADSAPRDAEADRRRLGHIRAAGRHLLSLIDDVLELSRLDGDEIPVAIEPLPLSASVAAVLPLVEPLARAQGVVIDSGTLDTVPLVDATRMRQVLLNLLSNAIKYNRPGGSVTLQSSQSEGIVTVVVADTGRGMSAEQLGHLFEPFNRLGAENSGVEGTGIGLAIVKALVERMGGTITVSSTVEVGTRVELRLRSGCAAAPAHEGPMASAQELALAATLGRGGGGGSVLYIEDNPVNALIVGELLARRSDLRLHIAPDGTCGLQQARDCRPDLILLDMQLPDLDGMQVLARLKSDPATAHIPCIALSANAMAADIEQAFQAGVADYWTKPLDMRAFMASIDAIFGPAA